MREGKLKREANQNTVLKFSAGIFKSASSRSAPPNSNPAPVANKTSYNLRPRAGSSARKSKNDSTSSGPGGDDPKDGNSRNHSNNDPVPLENQVVLRNIDQLEHLDPSAVVLLLTAGGTVDDRVVLVREAWDRGFHFVNTQLLQQASLRIYMLQQAALQDVLDNDQDDADYVPSEEEPEQEQQATQQLQNEEQPANDDPSQDQGVSSDEGSDDDYIPDEENEETEQQEQPQDSDQKEEHQEEPANDETRQDQEPDAGQEQQVSQLLHNEEEPANDEPRQDQRLSSDDDEAEQEEQAPEVDPVPLQNHVVLRNVAQLEDLDPSEVLLLLTAGGTVDDRVVLVRAAWDTGFHFVNTQLLRQASLRIFMLRQAALQDVLDNDPDDADYVPSEEEPEPELLQNEEQPANDDPSQDQGVGSDDAEDDETEQEEQAPEVDQPANHEPRHDQELGSDESSDDEEYVPSTEEEDDDIGDNVDFNDASWLYFSSESGSEDEGADSDYYPPSESD